MGRRTGSIAAPKVSGEACRARVLHALGRADVEQQSFVSRWRGAHSDHSACEAELSLTEMPNHSNMLSVRFVSDPAVWPYGGLLLSGAQDDELMHTTQWTCQATETEVRIEHEYTDVFEPHRSHSRYLTLIQKIGGQIEMTYTVEGEDVSCLLTLWSGD